jgi:hypothetical protein
MSRVSRASFVVRVVHDRTGQVSGVIERVATGAKEAFTDMEVIGRIIQRMLHREGGGLPPACSSTPASGEQPDRGTRPRGGSAPPSPDRP